MSLESLITLFLRKIAKSRDVKFISISLIVGTFLSTVYLSTILYASKIRILKPVVSFKANFNFLPSNVPENHSSLNILSGPLSAMHHHLVPSPGRPIISFRMGGKGSRIHEHVRNPIMDRVYGGAGLAREGVLGFIVIQFGMILGTDKNFAEKGG